VVRPDTVPRRRARTAAAAACVLSACGSALVAFGFEYWLLHLAAFAVPLYFVLPIPALLLALVERRPYQLGLPVFAISLASMLLIPFALPWGTPVSAGGDASTLRLMTANVYESNDRYDALLEQVSEARPEIVALQEMTTQWRRGLAPLEHDYPHRLWLPREAGATSHLGLYSKHPLTLIESPAPEFPALLAHVDHPHAPFIAAVVHTASPFSPGRAERHDRQMAALAKALRRHAADGPVIALGDFNTTPWSPKYRRLTDSTHLITTRRGRGLLGTWPSLLPLLRVPLDDILVSRETAVTECRPGRAFGSDHLPLIADIALNPGNVGLPAPTPSER